MRVRRTSLPPGTAGPLPARREAMPPAVANGNGHRPPAAGHGNGGRPSAGGALVPTGRCRCGMPATTRCEEGCGQPMCGEHLLNRASRLAWPGPYRSEREHTAWLRAFWADPGRRCTWCREEVGRAALAALPPVPPLPENVVERLDVLIRHPHDYPGEAWSDTVRAQGGAAALVRRLAPDLLRCRPAQEFAGRRRGEVLVGVAIGPPAPRPVYDVVDAAGDAWTVRLLDETLVRKRRAWAWERTDDVRLERLLEGMVEQVRRR